MKILDRVSPEAVGISSDALIKLLKTLASMDSLNGIMILRHGKVCMEGWWTPYGAEIPHGLFSLSKSFTSVAIGMAQAEKRLKITDRLCSFFPEYESYITDSKMKNVTLRHLLIMASGHATCAKPLMEADVDGNWARGFIASKLQMAPGEGFVYNSAATYMLAAVIHKITGMNVREYLMPRLFEPLGIVPGIWECCPKGINVGGWGLFLRTADIARFGQLLLDNGVHEGAQLIPADYLAEATSRQIGNAMNIAPDWKCGYGYQFWISQHGYRGDGASGQYAVVLPEHDMVIAVNSCIADMQQILTAFWEQLLPTVGKNALPENPVAERQLKSALAALAIPCLSGDLVTRRANVFYEFMENPVGIKSCAVEFEENECALTFVGKHGPEQLRAGFGGYRYNVFQLTDQMPHKVAASAAWGAENILEIRAICYDTTFTDIYRIDFSNLEMPLTRESLFSTFRPLLPDLKVKSK